MSLDHQGSLCHLDFRLEGSGLYVSAEFFVCFFTSSTSFWLCWVIIAGQAFLWLQGEGATLQLRCTGFSLQGLLSLWSAGSGALGLQRLRRVVSTVAAPGSRAQAQQLLRTGLVAPRHVGSSWIRDGTCASCFGSQIPYHRATREAPFLLFHSPLVCGAVKAAPGYVHTHCLLTSVSQ